MEQGTMLKGSILKPVSIQLCPSITSVRDSETLQVEQEETTDFLLKYINNNNNKKLRGLSPQANYTDRATAACWRSLRQILRIEGVAWSAQRIPTAVKLCFLDPEPLLFHSCSSSVILTRLSGPRSRLTTSQHIW
jgi:hypothetical protein